VTIHPDQSVESLTPRELEVLRWMAHGLSNREIAEQLAVNERTIKHHVSEILSKLEVENRTQAVTYGAAHGLITLE
jgi:NarL family two-component system response regulator LiaR